jgi:hypothetical protein
VKKNAYKALVFGDIQHFVFLKNKKSEELPLSKEGDAAFYKYFLMHRKGFYSMPWIYLFLSSRSLNKNSSIIITNAL